MNLKYLIGVLMSFPLLPLLIYDGRKVKNSVPELPEAKDLEGKCLIDSNQTFTMLAIGESTIAGVGAKSNNEGYVGSLARSLAKELNANIEWKVYAKSGYSAIEVNNLIIPEIKCENPDLIVVGLGGNDSFNLNTPGRWKNEIERLIEMLKLKFPSTPIYFNKIPPIKIFPAFTSTMKFTIGNLAEILGEELSNLVNQYDHVFYSAGPIKIEDLTRIDNSEPDLNEYFSDGVHPSEKAYKALADNMAKFIIENWDGNSVSKS
ncbi:SGNH/GDSL hydrolase family protein [Marinigracilibium pacificum]|uniref:SGNH/GDSL hydrolase family protein n=1 Tax=Marinigracilibium pacificum TaxID=2729599 RepID=A0A848IY80_9BACT|nr:SGNH/GDSL hydrolase family protein [Marinigracilibium pacificum]NMM49247.1 SGNH/GDSL hydrolase family protein [Marinigracilibium pacificum]